MQRRSRNLRTHSCLDANMYAIAQSQTKKKQKKNLHIFIHDVVQTQKIIEKTLHLAIKAIKGDR